jgi:hypothetical protein
MIEAAQQLYEQYTQRGAPSPTQQRERPKLISG